MDEVHDLRADDVVMPEEGLAQAVALPRQDGRALLRKPGGRSLPERHFEGFEFCCRPVRGRRVIDLI